MDWSLITLGASGGVIPDVLRIVQGRYEEELPKHLKRPVFWLGLALLVGLGGFAAWLGGAKDPQSALALGYAAPELISRVLSAKQPLNLATPGGVIRRWWYF